MSSPFRPIESHGHKNTYVIDVESAAELARLMNQDRVLTNALNALFQHEPDFSTAHSILDLACGPGGWAIDMAKAYHDRGIQVVGVDLSQSMIRYARAQAEALELDNATFLVMDVTKPLAFPDASFDIINARLLLAFMSHHLWPQLLQECYRVLRKGGILRLTEMEVSTSNKPAFEKVAGWSTLSLKNAGKTFSPDGRHLGVITMLAHWLRSAGYKDVKTRAFALDLSASAEYHEALCQNFNVLTVLMEPFFTKFGACTHEEFEEMYRQMLVEMDEDDFCAIWPYLAAWGVK